MYYLAALLLGGAAGLRALIAPTVVSWAAWAGALDLSGTWLAFMGYEWTPYVFTLAAAAELVADKLPGTPNRTVPPQFGARLLFGALSGAAAGLAGGSWSVGALLGVVGAVIGTLSGFRARAALARWLTSDLMAAAVEDVAAILISLLVCVVVF